MQLRPASEGFPYGTASAACYLCNGGSGGDGSNAVLIDLECQIDMEGWLMICQGCGEAISRLLGCIPQVEADRLKARLRSTEDDLLQMESELRAIEGRVVEAVHGR